MHAAPIALRANRDLPNPHFAASDTRTFANQAAASSCPVNPNASQYRCAVASHAAPTCPRSFMYLPQPIIHLLPLPSTPTTTTTYPLTQPDPATFLNAAAPSQAKQPLQPPVTPPTNNPSTASSNYFNEHQYLVSDPTLPAKPESSAQHPKPCQSNK